MTAILWLLGGIFLPGTVFLVAELRRAPEGTEDESGFRVVRQAPDLRNAGGPAQADRIRRAWRTDSSLGRA